MEKLDIKDTQTLNIVDENIKQLKEIFPEVFRENKVDFDRLQELLGNYVNDSEENYNFTWHGKRRAARLAQTPSTGTLRPCKEESVDFDKTQNLFIEGDNLEVLKLLQKSYHRKVKMIYIDPPYNTGNDFVYEDDFKDGVKHYLEMTGQVDGEGKKLGTNSSSAGRYHTNWLNMMYPRLRLARNLLSDDGVIFISIDEHEHSNLRKLLDEVFGESNFMGEVCRATGQTTGQDSGGMGTSFDFILVYSKTSGFDLSGLPLNEKDLLRFENEDEKGKYAYDQMRKTGSNDRREDRPKLFYPVLDPDNKEVLPIAPAGYESTWRFEKKTYDRLNSEGFILWKKSKREGGEIWWPYVKYYLEGRTKRPSPLWNDLEGNKKATRDVRAIFDGVKVFDFPKPIQMLQRCIQIAPGASENDIILDFFAGSGSSAHAVMDLNAKNNGKRQFICVQLPEQIKEDTEAYKYGYKNIADLSKERIRRAAKKIKEENPDYKGDLGFKVLKLDSSNIKTWEAGFDSLKEDLFNAVDYIKQDRSKEDILYELLLKYGLDLTAPIETKNIVGKTVYSVGLGALIVCLESDISADVVNGIVELKEQLKPEVTRVVFKDNGFKDDVVKTNTLQILKRAGIEDVKSL